MISTHNRQIAVNWDDVKGGKIIKIITIKIISDSSDLERNINYMKQQIEDEWGYEYDIDYVIEVEEG